MKLGSKHSQESRDLMVAAQTFRMENPSLHRKPRRRPPAKPPVDRSMVWFPEMIAAFHAGIAAGHTRIQIAERIGVSVPTMYKAIKSGVLVQQVSA
jgi:hypothetical protein